MAAAAFDGDLFETRLEALKDTQEGIQQMSSWCLEQRVHHKKIVAAWLNVLKRVRVEHRLVLFYLANDVIQYSKRKRYEFVESWATALQRATTMVRDEKVKGKILRIFNIWEQREIYTEEYLSDLSGLLNINPPKKATAAIETSDDFQNTTIAANIRECVELSEATDKSFKKMPKAPNFDIENIKQQLKDKSHSEDVEKEIERYKTYTEAYNKNLQTEIKSRKAVIASLEAAMKFYAHQRGEVKVVVNAYKNFGSRIKLVKKKLDEITPNLPSPIPSPDINAPSPEPDTDLQLPDEQSTISINLFKNSINGYSSYLDGNLPFDINDFKSEDVMTSKTSSQPIEVIGSRSDDESYSSSVEYYKPESINTYSNDASITIPGLNSMSVPPVSEYTSLARSAQQYSGVLPPPNAAAALFGDNGRNNNGHGSNLHHNNMSGYYNPANNYHNDNNSYNRGGNAVGPPLMAPPPMPTSSASVLGANGRLSSGSDDFNSTWNMDMSWTTQHDTTTDTSAIDTPVSPPHFERESSSVNAATIEYSERHHDGSMVMSAQDVDHRQLHMPPFGSGGAKLGLSKDKTRQLDIDHRNLISLTGSPGTNEQDKHAWLSGEDKDFRSSRTGDMDYRAGLIPALHTIDTISIPGIGTDNNTPSDSSITSPTNLMAPPSSSITKKSSPQKSNASSSSESQKDDTICTDMVIDMDMSDEDLDDILREVNAQDDEQFDNSQATATTVSDVAASLLTPTTNSNNDAQTLALNGSSGARPALLETPPEYAQQNIWDPAAMQQQMNMSGGGYGSPEMDVHPAAQPDWNQMPWNGRRGESGVMVPPPPRPPFPMQFQYPNPPANMDYVRGRGRGGGAWPPASPQYRNFQRPPRGGSPYFNRGGRGIGPGGPGGGLRGSYRGKFRGNNSWI